MVIFFFLFRFLFCRRNYLQRGVSDLLFWPSEKGNLWVGMHLLLCGLSFCAADAEYQTDLCILCVFFSDFMRPNVK